MGEAVGYVGKGLILVVALVFLGILVDSTLDDYSECKLEKPKFSVGERIRLFDYPEIVGKIERFDYFDEGIFYKVRIISPHSGEPNKYWYMESELRPYRESIYRERGVNE